MHNEVVARRLIDITSKFKKQKLLSTNDKPVIFDLNDDKILHTLNAIKKGFPIGGLILAEINFNDPVTYIVDGYQMIHLLSHCFNEDNNEHTNEFNTFYDFENQMFVKGNENNNISIIPSHYLVHTRKAFKYQEELAKSELSPEKAELYMERYAILGSKIIDFIIPETTIHRGELNEIISYYNN
jgi:hypothetical protein